MPKTIDVYRDWLGITAAERPLSFYQLLRLKQFEDDPERIRQHYRKMNAHVRKFAAGDFARQSQELLNELSRAMLCLTDAARKREYDAAQGRVSAGEGLQRTLEQILLARQVVDAAGLAKARSYATAVGVDIRDALVQQRLAKAEVVMPAYAESVGLPYLDLADVTLDAELLGRVPAVLARQHSCVPVMIDQGYLLLAAPHLLDPAVEDELRLRVGLPVRMVLCAAAAVHAAIHQHYSRQAAAAELAVPPGQRASGASGSMPAVAAATSAAEVGAPVRRQRTALAAGGGAAVLSAGLFLGVLRLEPLPLSLGLAVVVGLAAAAIAWKALDARPG
jgi:hypothetical protein